MNRHRTHLPGYPTPQTPHDNPKNRTPPLGRFAVDTRYTWFHNWVNGPTGQRLRPTPSPKPRSTSERYTKR
jgi:hypothetical protein